MTSQIFEDQQFTDITFQLDDGEINAHKCILASSGIAYFDTLLNSQNRWKENSDNIVVINDCPKYKFEYVIKSAYNCKLYNDKEFDINLFNDLIEVGDRFMSQKCIDHAIEMFDKAYNSTHKDNILVQYYKDIVKISMKFEPRYDYILKKNSLYGNYNSVVEEDYDIDSKVYIAKLTSFHEIKLGILKSILYPTFTMNPENKKYVEDLLEVIDFQKLTGTILLLLVKYKFYDPIEVLKYKTWNASELCIYKSYPLIILKFVHIGTFSNGTFINNGNNENNKRLMSKLKLEDISHFRLTNEKIGIDLIYNKEYAVYDGDEFVNFKESIYNKIYVNPDDKTFSLNKEVKYDVFVYLNW